MPASRPVCPREDSSCWSAEFALCVDRDWGGGAILHATSPRTLRPGPTGCCAAAAVRCGAVRRQGPGTGRRSGAYGFAYFCVPDRPLPLSGVARRSARGARRAFGIDCNPRRTGRMKLLETRALKFDVCVVPRVYRRPRRTVLLEWRPSPAPPRQGIALMNSMTTKKKSYATFGIRDSEAPMSLCTSHCSVEIRLATRCCCHGNRRGEPPPVTMALLGAVPRTGLVGLGGPRGHQAHCLSLPGGAAMRPPGWGRG